MCLAYAGGLLLAACAGQQTVPLEGQAQETVGGGVKEVSGDSEAVYLLLTAELAGQRGEYETALDNYLKASVLTRDARVAERAVQIALYLKKTDRALEAARLWRERAPDSPEAARLYAMLLAKNGRADEALEQLRQFLAMPKVDLENSLIELVKLLNADMSKEDGLNLMRRLLESYPRMAELHFAYALLATDKEEYRLALEEAERALALHPDWNRARLLQAQVMSRMGDSQKAREAIEQALKRDPGNIRLRMIYSQFIAKAGDKRGAERELEKILAKEPGNEDARFGLASLQMENGKLEPARQSFMRLSESARWKMQAFFYLGLIEARKNRLQPALQWFDKVTEGQLAFDAKVNAITALISLGQTTEARRRLADVRGHFPQEALRLYLLEAELLTKNKDYAGAFEVLSQALEEMPGQPELLYTRALTAEQLDRVDVVEGDLRAVLEKNPDDANALNALGFTLADRNEKLEEAGKYLARALELKPDDPAILDSYGWLRYRQGDYPTAVEYLQRAYDKLKDPEIGSHLGEALWASGKRQEAREVLRETLRKGGPEHENVKKVMEKYPEAFR
jgi:tetratricopeptide (TPR) repeat protein